MTAPIKPGDQIYAQHDPARQVLVYDRDWPDPARRAARVWRRAPGEQPVDITTQVDRVTVSEESLTIESGGKRAHASLGRERARGMVSGIVDRVEDAS